MYNKVTDTRRVIWNIGLGWCTIVILATYWRFNNILLTAYWGSLKTSFIRFGSGIWSIPAAMGCNKVHDLFMIDPLPGQHLFLESCVEQLEVPFQWKPQILIQGTATKVSNRRIWFVPSQNLVSCNGSYVYILLPSLTFSNASLEYVDGSKRTHVQNNLWSSLKALELVCK